MISKASTAHASAPMQMPQPDEALTAGSNPAAPRGWNIQSVVQIMLLWGGSLAGAGLAFLTQTALGRHLGPVDYGTFSTGLAQSILLSQIAGIGLQTFWLSAFGREGSAALRWMPSSLKLLSLTSTAAVLTLLVLTAVTATNNRTTLALLCMTPSILGFAAVELVATKLQLEERFLSLSIWQTAHHFARFCIVLIILKLQSGDLLVGASMTYSAVAFGILAPAYLHIRGITKGKLDLKGHEVHIGPGDSLHRAPTLFETLRATWPFCADAFLFIAYFQCSNILLLYLADEKSAGIYFSAFNILNAIYLLPTVLYTKFLLARLHRWAHHDKAKLLKAFKAGLAGMALAGLTGYLFVHLASSGIVLFAYGKNFQDAAAVLLILATCIPLRFLSTSIGALLTTGQQMMNRVKMKAICTAICIISNLLLIPSHGASGAAVSTVITELSLLLLFSASIAVRKREIFY